MSMFFLDSLREIVLRVYIPKGPTRRNRPSLRYSPERLIEDCLYCIDISFNSNILQFRIILYLIAKFQRQNYADGTSISLYIFYV